LEERDSQQDRGIAGLEAKQSQLAQFPAELAWMQTGLVGPTSGVQTTLPQLQASSEVRQRQLSREVERQQSEISGLQALAADHVCQGEVEATCQEVNADAAAQDSLNSFIFTLKNPHNTPARKLALKSLDGRILNDICVLNHCECVHQRHRTGWKHVLRRFNTFHDEGNRSLQDHRLNSSSKQILFAMHLQTSASARLQRNGEPASISASSLHAKSFSFVALKQFIFAARK
jgi:hypothetical protein